MSATASDLILTGSLTDRERQVWALLRGGDARSIALLAAATGMLLADSTPRKRQQRVGAIVCRLNRKLFGYRIVPGDRRRTYQLKSVS